jgi:hypothetical protein
MIKKKAKKKATTKTNAKKKGSTKSKKELNPADVRRDIAQMVDSQATTMAQAVIDEGKKGQLATVRYLFEMAEIYPPSTDGSHATTDEDSLARTLLNRMGIPEEPIARDEEEDPKAASGDKPAAKPAGVDGEKDSGSDTGSGEQKKEPVVM